MNIKQETHHYIGIFLDIGYRSVGRSVTSSLRNFLTFNNFYNCSVCGGLIPELCFEFQKKKYFFTCYKIEDQNGKAIKQTDYKTMLNYLQQSEKQRISQQRHHAIMEE